MLKTDRWTYVLTASNNDGNKKFVINVLRVFLLRGHRPLRPTVLTTRIYSTPNQWSVSSVPYVYHHLVIWPVLNLGMGSALPVIYPPENVNVFFFVSIIIMPE